MPVGRHGCKSISPQREKPLSDPSGHINNLAHKLLTYRDQNIAQRVGSQPKGGLEWQRAEEQDVTQT